MGTKYNVNAATGDIWTAGSFEAAGDVIVQGSLFVYGTTTTIDTSNLVVEDKTITCNHGGIASSGFECGLDVEEDGLITSYIRTNLARDGWSFKAPANAFVASIKALVTSTISLSGDLTVSADSAINQDVSTTADVTFNSITTVAPATLGDSIILKHSDPIVESGDIIATLDMLATDTDTQGGVYESVGAIKLIATEDFSGAATAGTKLAFFTNENGTEVPNENMSLVGKDLSVVGGVSSNSLTAPALTLTGMSGVLKSTGGTIAGGATEDDVADGVTYKRVKATSLSSNEVVKLTDAGGDDLTIVLNGSDRVATIKASVTLDQSVDTLSSPSFANVTSTNTPTTATHAANKGYVDGRFNSLDWQESVISRWDSSVALPIGPSLGDRYLCSVSGTGWTVDKIYEYNGISWTEITPDEGSVVWVASEIKALIYHAAAWITFTTGGSGSGAGVVFTQSVAAQTWTVGHGLGSQFVNVTCYDASNNEIIPDVVNAVDSSTLSITFATSRTGKVVVSAPTVVATSSYLHIESGPSMTWSIVHNLNTQYVTAQVYDTADEAIYPETIVATDANTLTLTFNEAVAGRVRIMAGGSPNGVTSYNLTTIDATEASLFEIVLNDNTTDLLDVLITAVRDDGAKQLAVHLNYAAYRNGGGAVQLIANTPLAANAYDGAVFTKCECDVSGNTIRLRIAGAVGSTINWKAIYTENLR